MPGLSSNACSLFATTSACLSEEYDVNLKRLVGNFPQAFSHIALVNAAFDLEDGPDARSRSHRKNHYT